MLRQLRRPLQDQAVGLLAVVIQEFKELAPRLKGRYPEPITQEEGLKRLGDRLGKYERTDGQRRTQGKW